jgi:MSHA biogenesis protein MshP
VTANISGPGGDTVFSIESRGQCGVGVDSAVRVVEVRVR